MTLTWYAAQTNPRCEAKAVASLTEAGIPAYCPRSHIVTRHRRHNFEVTRDPAILTGYVFIGGGVNEAAKAHGKQGVHKVLTLNGQFCPMPAGYVERLRDAEFRGDFSTIMQARKEALSALRQPYRRGDMVEVVSGVFASRNGVIAKMMGKHKAVLQIADFLGALAEVTVDTSILRAA